jgi:hypothetical protein
MFVLIMGDAQFMLTSEDARRLYLADGPHWKVKGRMADRVQIDCTGIAYPYTLTAPTTWREMIGAQR